MANRLAGVLGLIAFAVCLIVGLTETDNGFGTVVWRALIALVGSVVVGYVVGLAAEKMLDENLNDIGKRSGETSTESATDGR